MNAHASQLAPVTESASSGVKFTLQRACSCADHATAEGQCDSCKNQDGVLARYPRGASDFIQTPLLSTSPAAISEEPAADRTAVQPKLIIGHVDDPLEREADRAAEHVMRMPSPAPLRLSRKCACGGEEAQRKETTPEDRNGDVAPAAVHEVLRSSGHQLDPATRAFFEPRFGRDLSQVRVSADTAAARSAASVGARAYTVGGRIAFAAGQYAPESTSGRQLLAHELAHVIQQGQAGPPVLRRSPDKYVGLSIEQLRALAGQGDEEAVWALIARYDAMPAGVVHQYALNGKDGAALYSYTKRVIPPKAAAGTGTFSKPGIHDTLTNDISAGRQTTGIPRRAPSAVEPDIELTGGTSGAARTDVPGLENRAFLGQSKLAGGPGYNPQSSFSPATDVTKLPHTHGHAEQHIADQLEEALAKIPREQLKGRRVWMLIEQTPCAACAAGAVKTNTAAGVLKKLSLKYPELTIEVKSLENNSLIVLKGTETAAAAGAAGAAPQQGVGASAGEQTTSVQVETKIEVTKSVRSADGATISEVEYNLGKGLEEINGGAPSGAKVPDRIVIRVTQNADGSLAAVESLSGHPKALVEALAQKTLAGPGAAPAAAVEGTASAAAAGRRAALLFKGLKIGGTAAFVIITGYQLYAATPKERPRVVAGAAGGLAGGALGTYLLCNLAFGIETAGWSLLFCGLGAGAVGGYAGTKAGEAVYDEATATDLDRAYRVLAGKKPNEVGIFNVLVGKMQSDGCIDAEFVYGFMNAFPESVSDTETVLIAAQLADAVIDTVPGVRTTLPPERPSAVREAVCPACHGRSMEEVAPPTMTPAQLDALKRLPTCWTVTGQALNALRSAVKNLPPRMRAAGADEKSSSATSTSASATAKQQPSDPKSFPSEREQLGTVCPNCHVPNKGKQVWQDFGTGPGGKVTDADMQRLKEWAAAQTK